MPQAPQNNRERFFYCKVADLKAPSEVQIFSFQLHVVGTYFPSLIEALPVSDAGLHKAESRSEELIRCYLYFTTVTSYCTEENVRLSPQYV